MRFTQCRAAALRCRPKTKCRTDAHSHRLGKEREKTKCRSSIKLSRSSAVKNHRLKKTSLRSTRSCRSPALFDGISRTYQPTDEEGETQPPERKNVQYTAKQAMNEARSALMDLFNVTATQDFANCEARADVVVDDLTLIENAPVTHLLFVEKQLKDLHTFVSTIPVLDAGEKWEWDETADCYSSETFVTNRTKKTPRSHISLRSYQRTPGSGRNVHGRCKSR